MLTNWWKRTYCKGKRGSLVVASKEIGLEANADKAKYMVMPGIVTQGGMTLCNLIIIPM
jgi:hypothetical protein